MHFFPFWKHTILSFLQGSRSSILIGVLLSSFIAISIFFKMDYLPFVDFDINSGMDTDDEILQE